MKGRGEPQSGPQGVRGVISLSACVVFGAAVGGFAALGALRFGEAFGSFLPIAAAAIGAVAGRVFYSSFKGKNYRANRPKSARPNVDGVADDVDSSGKSDASVPPGSEVAAMSDSKEKSDVATVPPPVEPEWPVETYEVQVKLDLARSYVELGDTELALQYLQEVLETELAIGRKLGSEVLQENRQHPRENGTVGPE
ncbi:MAG: FimV/HubP family polar landmark protein [Sedimenticolaceae bacterium]